MKFFDTHCHLNLNEFNTRLENVIDLARSNMVDYMLIPGIDLESSKKAVQIAAANTNIFAAVGFHPNDGLKWNSKSFDDLSALANHPKVVAIGEIGLDQHWNDCPFEIQKEILRKQLNLATEKKLPVILHSRKTMQELKEIVLDWHKSENNSAENPGVFHAFEGDIEDMQQVTKAGYKIGIGCPVTFKNAKLKQEVVFNASLDTILLETDAPYLAPQPYRGKKNEPAYIPLIAEKIATIKSLPIEEVARITTHTAKFTFSEK